MFAEDVDSVREQAEDYVGAGSPHGGASQVHILVNFHNAAEKRNAILEGR
jgi:hypothetical protein